MKKLIAICMLWPSFGIAQTINVDQLRPSTTPGQVVGTVSGTPNTTQWINAAGTSVQGTAPIQVNGDSGTPHTGATVVACPSCGQLLQNITGLPTGQHALIFPSACTAGPSTVSSCFANGASGSGSIVCEGSCFFGIGNGLGSWSSWSLPAGWSQSNVTQVIAVSVGSTYGSPGEEEYTCTDGTHDTTLGGLGSGYGQITSTFGTIPTVASTHCDFLISSSLVGAPSTAGNIASIALAVYDSVDPPVTPPSTTGVALPLIVTNNILQLSSPFDKGLDTGTVNAYQVVIPLLTNGPEIGDAMTLFVANANTITAPTVTVLNTVDHAAYPIINQNGTALIASQLQPSIPYHMIFDGTSWRVQATTNISVNGTLINGANFNDSSPTAPTGGINNKWQHTSNSVSSYTPAATGTTPGVIKPDGSTCTVTGGVLTCTGSAGSNANLQNAIVLSPNCGSSSNCVTVHDDVQVAMTAVYNTTYSGGTSMTTVTTGANTSGAQYGTATNSGPQGVFFSTGSGEHYSTIAQAFKVSGSPGTPVCWGSSAGSNPATVSVSPTGGSGHVLVAFARESGVPITTTFTDSNSQVYTPFLSNFPSQFTSFAGAWVQNPVGGTYTVAATFSAGSSSRIFACELTGLASSAAADGPAGFSSNPVGSVTHMVAIIDPANTGDFVFQAADVNDSGASYTAGTVGGSIAVATQLSDPPFVVGDIGKKFVVNTACDSGNGYMDCSQAIGPGSIVSFTDAHHIGVAGVPILASSSTGTNFTGWFAWGTDDTAALKTGWSDMLATQHAALYFPCGLMFFSSAPFTSPSTGMYNNPSLKGCAGQGGTTFIPTADFDYFGTNALDGMFYSYTASNDAGFGSGFQNPYLWSEIDDLTVTGLGYGADGLTNSTPVFNAALVKMRNVHVSGWLWNVNAITPVIKVATIIGENIGGWAAGTDGLNITGVDTPSFISSSVKDCFFGPQTWNNTPNIFGNSLHLQGGQLTTMGCTFNPPSEPSPNSDKAALIGGFWTSSGDGIGGMTIDGGAFVSLTGSSTTYLHHYGVTVNGTGGTLVASGSQIDQLTLGGTASFSDLGGNYSCRDTPGEVACGGMTDATAWTNNPLGGNSFASGSRIIGNASAGGIGADPALASSNLVLTSGWGSGTVGSVSGSSLGGSFTITEGGSPGASPVLTLTFPTKFAIAPASCIIDQTAGNFTLSNPVTSSLTATGVVFTWTGTPGATDSYTFAFRCGN